MNHRFISSSRSGLTLIELMIAVSLFTVVILTATTIFMRSIDSQGKSVISKNLQEGLQYAMTKMMIESEGAKYEGNSACCIDIILDSGFYCGNATTVTFQAADDTCVSYALETDGKGLNRIKATYDGEDTYLTPATFTVSELNFAFSQASDATYPTGRLTVSMKGETLTGAPFSDSLRLQGTSAIWPEN